LNAAVGDRESRALAQWARSAEATHFVEVCVEQGADGDPPVWLMLHSGSRNIGKELAERHINVAKALPHNQDLPGRDLGGVLSGTPEMDAYCSDLYWSQDYARRNHEVMIAWCCHAPAKRASSRTSGSIPGFRSTPS